MVDASSIPGAEQIKTILSEVDAPPHIVLDIGGSADINGDGLVKVSLSEGGELVVEDA